MNKVSKVTPVKKYDPCGIKQIRTNLGVTQVMFAMLLGVSNKTVEAWEAGRNIPDGPARRLLSMIEDDPEIFVKTGIVTMNEVIE